MNRKGFLRSIFVVVAAPKIMMELQTKNIATLLSYGCTIDQDFFNKAFAEHYNGNKIYKECYKVDIVSDSTMCMWLDEFNEKYLNLNYDKRTHQ